MTDIKNMIPTEIVILIEQATAELSSKQYAQGYKDGFEDCKKAMEQKEAVSNFVLKNCTIEKENECE